MCCPASIAAIGAAVVGAVAGGVNANMSRIQAGQQQQAQADAVKAAGTAQKGTAADTSQLNAGGTPASAGVNSGPASTLLTGSGGISNSSLNLGGGGLGTNTILGQ